MENDRVSQAVAAIVGVLVIVVLVLFARWTGDRIRERFLAPKPSVVTTKPQPVTVTETPKMEDQTLPAATYSGTVSTIPSTGPADFGYYLLGLAFLAGTFLKLRISIDSPK